MKTTKRQTTQTLQEKLSEIDWDLLEQLDQEEEGQSIPMQDLVQTTASSPTSSTPLGIRVDEHPGPVLGGPPKGLLSQE